MAEKKESGAYLLGVDQSTLHRYRLFNEIYQPGTLQRLASIELAPNAQVLEVGCGIGETACYFAKNIVPDGHVTAFDRAPELVSIAQRNATEQGISNVTFLCCAAQNFNFIADQFDLAHTRYVLSYLPDAVEVVAKIYSALRPSGLFFSEEISQAHIKQGRSAWYDQMGVWFVNLIEAGGGQADYGLDKLPGDMLEAGFVDVNVSAFWPFEDQQKVVEMLRICLSHEMRPPLVDLGFARDEDVEAVIAELNKPERDYVISAAAAIQVVGRKP